MNDDELFARLCAAGADTTADARALPERAARRRRRRRALAASVPVVVALAVIAAILVPRLGSADEERVFLAGPETSTVEAVVDGQADVDRDSLEVAPALPDRAAELHGRVLEVSALSGEVTATIEIGVQRGDGTEEVRVALGPDVPVVLVTTLDRRAAEGGALRRGDTVDVWVGEQLSSERPLPVELRSAEAVLARRTAEDAVGVQAPFDGEVTDVRPLAEGNDGRALRVRVATPFDGIGDVGEEIIGLVASDLVVGRVEDDGEVRALPVVQVDEGDRVRVWISSGSGARLSRPAQVSVTALLVNPRGERRSPGMHDPSSGPFDLGIPTATAVTVDEPIGGTVRTPALNGARLVLRRGPAHCEWEDVLLLNIELSDGQREQYAAPLPGYDGTGGLTIAPASLLGGVYDFVEPDFEPAGLRIHRRSSTGAEGPADHVLVESPGRPLERWERVAEPLVCA